jgi:hypothetical protein
MRRALAFVILLLGLCLFGFLGCTVDSQGTGAGLGGASGLDASGGTSGSAGGGCFPDGQHKFCGNQCVKTSDPTHGCANSNCNPCNKNNGTPDCTSAGACTITCTKGFGDCDGNVANGCETDTQTNPYDCGACVKDGGTDCFKDTTASNWECDNGVCKPSQCDVGKADCTGAGSCETDLTSDTNNCGSCQHVCALPNATPSCVAQTPGPNTPPGKCVVGQCNAGYADCNGDPTDGCEVDTQDGDPNNCGACGKKCDTTNAAASCSGGSCTIACKSGFGDCDGDVTNGCETNLANTTNDCGACGTACTNPNGTTTCSGSACHPVCTGTFKDCDGNPNNGCETNFQTDNNNCGNCGVKCTGGETCQAGTCKCPTGQVLNGGTCCTPESDATACGTTCNKNVTNNCGQSVACGNCGPGLVCYNNACCTPESDTTACGTTCNKSVTNNCGQSVACGNCGSGDVCDSNVCCTPKTCSGLGVSCGTPSDGCGGTVPCGNCGANQTCTGGSCVCNSGTHSCGTSQCYANNDAKNCGNDSSCTDCTQTSESCDGNTNGACCVPHNNNPGDIDCRHTTDPCCTVGDNCDDSGANQGVCH